jgi:phosphotransferase system  glucose/maltose/N-acetylglucosamine-specific IIC component
MTWDRERKTRKKRQILLIVNILLFSLIYKVIFLFLIKLAKDDKKLLSMHENKKERHTTDECKETNNKLMIIQSNAF